MDQFDAATNVSRVSQVMFDRQRGIHPGLLEKLIAPPWAATRPYGHCAP
ncbi:hypothetical protein [Acrocarpospora pleiomorpha]|nr:hypothetical protein [Acrocarpospora pleiomorpha]